MLDKVAAVNEVLATCFALIGSLTSVNPGLLKSKSQMREVNCRVMAVKLTN